MAQTNSLGERQSTDYKKLVATYILEIFIYIIKTLKNLFDRTIELTSLLRLLVFKSLLCKLKVY